MKKILLLGIILFLIVPAIGIAQSSVEFAYDQAGNRIQRQVIILGSKSATIATDNSPEKDLQYEWEEITIYPNPTEGLLSVSIGKLEGLTEGTIVVTDMNGQMVLTRQINSELTSIDLSSRPAGYYLMRISLGAETSTWKIIKK